MGNKNSNRVYMKGELMQKQKNKKENLFIILTITLIILVGMIVILVWICKSPKDNNQVVGEQTNVDVVKEIFPGLEGIEKVSWEVTNFSDGLGAPGPTELQFKGKIVLEEVANEYKNDYEWKEVNIDFYTDYINISEYQDDIWYYSDSFNKAVLSNTIMGKIYFNGKDMWFEVSQY